MADEQRGVSARAVIPAPAAEIFELIADPTRQPEWDGNDNLAVAAPGQRVRKVGDVFVMTTTKGKDRHHVVEFAEGERIAWLPSAAGEEPLGRDPILMGASAVQHGMSQHSPTQPILRRAAAAALALGILPAVLSGCSGEETPDAPDVTVEEGAALITISDFGYALTGTIEPGATVTITNQDNVGHTVTSDEGVFDVTAPAGETVTFTAPDEAGDYPFHCTPHPSMVAVLTVG